MGIFTDRSQFIMARHNPELVFCRKFNSTGYCVLCDNCDGKCVICDAFINPCKVVNLCEECYIYNLKTCIVCSTSGFSKAFYCRECVIMEKDARFFYLNIGKRDGCPKIINSVKSKIDLYVLREFF